MEDGILSLKWNNHNSTFIQTLSTLHNAETYSDVTIACEGKYFPVHKLVLSICSEYFEEILSRTKCQHPVIVLKDIKHGDLEALLNYMYAGEANVAQNELASLIKAAECLRIKGLAVPDEAPPVRDKRRQTEVSESANFSKRRRNEDVNLSISSQQAYRESDLKIESSRLSDTSKNKRRLEDGADRLADIQNDRSLTVTTLEEDNFQNIPEIVLDGQSVEVKQEMTEPKIEEHMEEDPHHHLESTELGLAYGVDIVDENSESERHGQESHILQDLMSHSGPGTSGIHGHDAMANWENNSNNLSGYSVDSYSSDEGRNQQLGDGGSSSATSSTFVSGGESGFLGSDLLGRALGSKDSSPTGFPGTFHQCQCCPKKFLTRQDLRRHFRTHTGERPFKCPFCSYRAALKGNVKKHVLSVHKIILSADGKGSSSSGSSGGGGTATQGVSVDLGDSTDTRWDT